MAWTAYVDESMRVAGDPQDRAYVLAAALVDTDYVDLLRPIVAALAVSGPRFHWRHESAKAQLKAVETVAALPALHVVVGTPLDLRRQERARRQCLERLLYELDAAGVAQVWLETRTKSLNRRDRQLVDALRIRRTISEQLRVDHDRPLDALLLWLGDLVAGAFASNDPRHRQTLEPVLLCDVCRVHLT